YRGARQRLVASPDRSGQRAPEPTADLDRAGLGGCPRITPNTSLGYVESCGSCVKPGTVPTLYGKRPLTPTWMAPEGPLCTYRTPPTQASPPSTRTRNARFSEDYPSSTPNTIHRESS